MAVALVFTLGLVSGTALSPAAVHGAYEVTPSEGSTDLLPDEELPVCGEPDAERTGPASDPVPGTLFARCTNWRLVAGPHGPDNQEVIVVRGVTRHSENIVTGQMFAAYRATGSPDLAAAGGDEWAIVLRDTAAVELARYPFERESPLAETELVAFGYRVPNLPGAVLIDLVGPGGLVDSLQRSDNSPILAVNAPWDQAELEAIEGKVRFEWEGVDADGDDLLFSVFYSPDDGETWRFVSFEQTASSQEVVLDVDRADHVVKVIATDGARSTEVLTRFSIAVAESEEGPAGPAAAAQSEGRPAGAIAGIVAGAVALVFAVLLYRWIRVRRAPKKGRIRR